MSFRKLLSRLLTSLAALGLAGVSATHAENGHSFGSVEAARAYLAQNPTGARAEEAFRIIVEGTLGASYPEFSRAELADGYARRAGSSHGAPRREVQGLLSELGGLAAQIPARGSRISRVY